MRFFRTLLAREFNLRFVVIAVIATLAVLLFTRTAPADGADPLIASLARLAGRFSHFAAGLASFAAMMIAVERVCTDRSSGWLIPLAGRRSVRHSYVALLAVAVGSAMTVLWLIAVVARALVGEAMPSGVLTLAAATWVRAVAGALYGSLVAMLLPFKSLAVIGVLTWTFGPALLEIQQLFATGGTHVPRAVQLLVLASPGGVLLQDALSITPALAAVLILTAVNVQAGPHRIAREW